MTNKSGYELWVRLPYKLLVRSGLMTTFIRPGDRRSPNLKGAKIGEKVVIKIIRKPGSEGEGKMPHFDSFKRQGKIRSITIKKIKGVTKKDLRGTPPDCIFPNAIPIHLGLHYGKEFGPDDLISIIRVSYL